MAGVIRLRDEFIPVVKRHAVFGMRDRAAAADGGKNGNAAALRDCIVICEMEGKKFGLPMEQVRQVVEFEEGRLQAVNRLGEPSETLIRQVGTWDGASVLFLDLDQLSIPDSSASQPRP
jgi:chemotaxis signal transduction protein